MDYSRLTELRIREERLLRAWLQTKAQRQSLEEHFTKGVGALLVRKPVKGFGVGRVLVKATK